MSDFEVCGADVHPFSFYPELIEWKLAKIKRIKSENLRNSISISIIIDCACLLEGVLNTINKEIIDISSGDYNSLQHRLIIMLEEKSEKAQFLESISIYSIIVGREIKDLLGNELWKSIKMLFTFRNKLVHGKIIQIFNSESDKGMEVLNSYKIIYDYLIEKKLIDRHNGDYENLLFQDNILKHFYESSLNFIKKVSENVPNSARDYVMEMTSSMCKIR